MRRLFLLSMIFMVVLALAGVSSAQGGDVLTSFIVRANFRDGPSPEWVIVGTYNAGTPIRLDGQAYDGTWVRGIVPDGTVGWVIVTGVGISQAQASKLPTAWVDTPFSLSAPAGDVPVVPTQVVAAAEATVEAVVEAEAAPETAASTFVPTGDIDDFLPENDGPAFYRWGNNDGRINLNNYLAGLAIYCVNRNGAPADTYRGGGISVLQPDGTSILFVPASTITSGYQTIQQTGQYVTLGTSDRLWYGGQPVALYLLASGEFQLNAASEDGKPLEFLFQGCIVVPKETNDGCAPGWDRDEHKNCVYRNLY